MESLSQLLRRISRAGISPAYVKKRVLPAWVADYPPTSDTAMFELKVHLARELGLELSSLENPGSVAFGPLPDATRYKRRVSTPPAKLRPTTAMFFSLAKAVLAGTAQKFVPLPKSAAKIRAEILEDASFVGLNSLLRYLWAHGIPVVHYSDLPRELPHPSAAAINIGGRPVVIIGSRKIENAWHAFYLAHELGHIVKGHLASGEIIVDVEDLGASAEEDPQEVEADAFANELLAGTSTIAYLDSRAGVQDLVKWARTSSETLHTDAGHLVLRHAMKSGMWDRSVLALQAIDAGANAARTINLDHANRKINKDSLPEDRLTFLNRILAPTA